MEKNQSNREKFDRLLAGLVPESLLDSMWDYMNGHADVIETDSGYYIRSDEGRTAFINDIAFEGLEKREREIEVISVRTFQEKKKNGEIASEPGRMTRVESLVCLGDYTLDLMSYNDIASEGGIKKRQFIAHVNSDTAPPIFWHLGKAFSKKELVHNWRKTYPKGTRIIRRKIGNLPPYTA